MDLCWGSREWDGTFLVVLGVSMKLLHPKLRHRVWCQSFPSQGQMPGLLDSYKSSMEIKSDIFSDDSVIIV